MASWAAKCERKDRELEAADDKTRKHVLAADASKRTYDAEVKRLTDAHEKVGPPGRPSGSRIQARQPLSPTALSLHEQVGPPSSVQPHQPPWVHLSAGGAVVPSPSLTCLCVHYVSVCAQEVLLLKEQHLKQMALMASAVAPPAPTDDKTKAAPAAALGEAHKGLLTQLEVLRTESRRTQEGFMEERRLLVEEAQAKLASQVRTGTLARPYIGPLRPYIGPVSPLYNPSPRCARGS